MKPEDIRTLRRLAAQVQNIIRPLPGVQTVQNDWFAESPEVKLLVDVDRANLAGVTNRDVADFDGGGDQRHDSNGVPARQPTDSGGRALAAAGTSATFRFGESLRLFVARSAESSAAICFEDQERIGNSADSAGRSTFALLAFMLTGRRACCRRKF